MGLDGFLVLTIVAMVAMAALTRSAAGAFLGLVVVCFGFGAYLVSQEDIASKIGAVLPLLFGGGALVFAFLLAVNLAFSRTTHLGQDGSRSQRDEWMVGDGAANLGHFPAKGYLPEPRQGRLEQGKQQQRGAMIDRGNYD